MIPKTIHYFWVGGNPKPESVLFCIDSWKKFCPDYEIVEWNESNYDFTKVEYMRQAYEAKKWGFVPDYARLDVLYQFGGIYLDTDVELIRSLDELLNNRAFMGFERSAGTKHSVALGLGFGAEAGNAVLKDMMREYESASFLKADGSLNLRSSPWYSTRFLTERGLENADRDQTVCGVTIFASDVLCPMTQGRTKLQLTDRTVSIHHYDGTWMTEAQLRIHKRNIVLNKIFGEHVGTLAVEFLNHLSYLGRRARERTAAMLTKRQG